MKEDSIEFESRDGIRIQAWRWAPEGTPRGVVQVQHGLGEHGARYRRFGEALTAAGYLVVAPDGRGSGRTAAGRYGHWGRDGWPGWVDDLVQLNRRIRQDHPGMKLALVGHSMGSFATQQFLLDHSAEVDAAVLLGSTEVSGIVAMMTAPGPVDLSTLNQGFEHRTGFEWLSRDAAEVDRYCADPACGFVPEPFTGIETLARAADPAALRLEALRSGLADVIRAHPYLPFLEFLAATTHFDGLIVNDAATRQHHDINPYLPSKISDYRGSGTPIWSIVEPGSVLSTLPTAYRSTLGDAEGALRVIREIIAAGPQHDAPAT